MARSVTLHHGNCLDVLRTLPSESVDSVVTDPPYGLSNTDPKHVIEALTRWASGERDFVPEGRGFMGKSWDSFVPPPAVWDECFRVLKPGGHLLAFAGSRTFDLMTLSIRFSGFEIRDSIAWLYGSGFPKSLDVSKAIDKAAGAEREVVGSKLNLPGYHLNGHDGGEAFGHGLSSSTPETRLASSQITAPATDDARAWEGWGTALKPAFEPVVVARKPLGEKTVAANVLAHGTGALNIGGCRIGDEVRHAAFTSLAPAHGNRLGAEGTQEARRGTQGDPKEYVGRWPANVVLDESQAEVLDEQSGDRPGFSGGGATPGEVSNDVYGKGWKRSLNPTTYGDSGGASRFFYVAKAPKKERPVIEHEDGTKTAHPTVKPLTLMRWLVKLVTPPGGTVLEPFPGSGTTVEAAVLEGFDCIAAEREAEYIPLIEQRLARNGVTPTIIRPEPEAPAMTWEERRVAAYWCPVYVPAPHPRGHQPGCECVGQLPEILPEVEPV